MNGKVIKQERIRRGMSQRQLADAVGVSQPAIKKIESGETQHSRFLPKIEMYLGLMGIASEAGAAATSHPARAPAMPIFGAIEITGDEFKVTPEPVANLPSISAVVPRAYAIYSRGDGMTPRYREGEIIVIHPFMPARGGDGVVLTHKDQERKKLRELVRTTPTHWIVKTLHPEKEHRVAREEWPTCELIMACIAHTG